MSKAPAGDHGINDLPGVPQAQSVLQLCMDKFIPLAPPLALARPLNKPSHEAPMLMLDAHAHVPR